MKVYTRLTPRDWHEAKVKYSTPQAQRIILKKCWNLENAIENGELCDCEEVRKETAREVYFWLIHNVKKLGIEGAIQGVYENFAIDKEDEEWQSRN